MSDGVIGPSATTCSVTPGTRPMPEPDEHVISTLMFAPFHFKQRSAALSRRYLPRRHPGCSPSRFSKIVQDHEHPPALARSTRMEVSTRGVSVLEDSSA